MSVITARLFPQPPQSGNTRAATGNVKATGVELLDRQVQFRVRDIYHPDPHALINQLYGDSILVGQVLEVTESDQSAQFAVVKVSGLNDPVLIAVDRIKTIT